MTAPELLSHREAAKYLHIRPGTLYVWRAENRYTIPFIRYGKKNGPVRYRPEDLDRFLDSRRVVPEERKPKAKSRRRKAA